MKHFLFNTAALVSLLLGLAIAGLWARSVWWTGDFVMGKIGYRALCGHSAHGRIFVFSVISLPYQKYFAWENWSPPATALPPVSIKGKVDGGPEWKVSVADWLLLCLCTPLPAWWLWRYHHPIYPSGHCASCGYDLRGSRGSCSECGAAQNPALDGSEARARP